MTSTFHVQQKRHRALGLRLPFLQNLGLRFKSKVELIFFLSRSGGAFAFEVVLQEEGHDSFEQGHDSVGPDCGEEEGLDSCPSEWREGQI